VRQQDAYPTNAKGAVKTVCNTLAHFSRATSSLLIVCLPLSSLYKNSLLELTAASQCRCVWKIRDSRRTSGRSLLDGHVWLPFGRSIIAYCMWANDRACRRNKQYPVMNSTATHQWTIVITQATNYPKIFWPPIWRSLKNIACTKSGETHVRDIALSSIMQFFTPIGAKYLSPGKKIHIFPYRGLLWRLPSQAIHLFESSRCADFKL